MRDPKEIVAKIKQVQFEHLKRVYSKNLTKEPRNCIYNKKVVIHGDPEVVTRICGYYSTDDTYEVCETTECSMRCNAFVSKYTKPQLREMLDNDIVKNPQNYPEVTALNWALSGPPVVSVGSITWFDKVKFGARSLWARVRQVFQRVGIKENP